MTEKLEKACNMFKHLAETNQAEMDLSRWGKHRHYMRGAVYAYVDAAAFLYRLITGDTSIGVDEVKWENGRITNLG